MSSTFSPIKLDKDLTKTGVKTALLAILNAPIGTFVGILMIGVLWFLYLTLLSPGKEELSAASDIVLTVMFVFGQIYLPALFGSYLMYRYTYKQRWLGFWQNIKDAGFVRFMMYELFFYVFIFTVMHFIFGFLGSGKSAESMEVTKSSVAVLASMSFWVVITIIAFYYWLDMSAEKSIALRTGFSLSESSKYRVQAKRLNPRLSGLSVGVTVLLFLLSSLLPIPVFLTGMVFGLVQILVSMFWIYVLFGNTFPTKVKESVSATSKVSNSVV